MSRVNFDKQYMHIFYYLSIYWFDTSLGQVVQSVASPIADPGVLSLNDEARAPPFVEIDQEIFSTIILFLPLIQEGLVSVTN